MKDLKNPKLMYLKALLFVIIALVGASILILQHPSLKTGLLIGLIAWASARAYYFLFYVIQTYIDEDYKYSGIFSCLRYLISTKQRTCD